MVDYSPRNRTCALAAEGNVSTFDDAETAEHALEPIDIENSEYKVFDCEGLLLRATATPDRLRVHLSDSVPPEREPDELVGVLRRFSSRLGPQRTGLQDEEVWRAPLPTLAERMQTVSRRTSRRYWWPWGRGRADAGNR